MFEMTFEKSLKVIVEMNSGYIKQSIAGTNDLTNGVDVILKTGI